MNEEVTVVFKHPHVLALDIKGNFHRGLMIGLAAGFALGVAVVSAAAVMLLSLVAR